MNRLKNDYLFTVKKNTVNYRELIDIITLLKKGGVAAMSSGLCGSVY